MDGGREEGMVGGREEGIDGGREEGMDGWREGGKEGGKGEREGWMERCMYGGRKGWMEGGWEEGWSDGRRERGKGQVIRVHHSTVLKEQAHEFIAIITCTVNCMLYNRLQMHRYKYFTT